MDNQMRFFAVVIAGLCGLAIAADPSPQQIVEPIDHGKALINPSMGWTLHYYSNIIANYGSKLEPSDTVDDFPGLSCVYLRVPWSFLEPQEGHFNWTLLDTPAQRWINKGKQIALRISACESWTRWATPKWVHDAGAKGYEFKPGAGVTDDGPFWEPDYKDPIFLDKLDRFLAAMAKRYDGNPHVAFVDIGSFGVWGEGHSWASSKLPFDDQARRIHVDLHVKHFKKTLLAISDDFAGPETPGAHLPITDYALSKGVTLRDDSICVQPAPKSWFHAELAQAFWPTLPVVLEHEHYGPSKQRKAWGDGSLLLKSIEDYHASYMSIHWWPREMLTENRQIIDRINRRIGYRLQLRRVAFPDRIRIGEPFTVTTTWANAGVAPCYPGGVIALTIKDDKGGIVCVVTDESYNVRELPIGPEGKADTKTIATTGTVALKTEGYAPPVMPGRYDLWISIGDADGTPRIALPHDPTDVQKRVRIGSVQLVIP